MVRAAADLLARFDEFADALLPGRAMGGFYVLPPELPEVEGWVRRSYEHAESLPPKQPKPRPSRSIS